MYSKGTQKVVCGRKRWKDDGEIDGFFAELAGPAGGLVAPVEPAAVLEAMAGGELAQQQGGEEQPAPREERTTAVAAVAAVAAAAEEVVVNALDMRKCCMARRGATRLAELLASPTCQCGCPACRSFHAAGVCVGPRARVCVCACPGVSLSAPCGFV